MALSFPDIDPIALSIGPLVIRWYALAYLAGFLLGWRYIVRLSRLGLNAHHRPNEEDLDDFMPWAVLGVILGGRLGYILFYQFDLYAANPLDIFKIWQGGMSFHGGVCGAIAVLFIYAWRQKIEMLRLADMFCAAAPIGLFFGRLANFVNGELFGRASDVPWAIVFPGGGAVSRHPSQIYEAILEGLVLFTVLFILARRKWVQAHPGVMTAVFLGGYGLARFSVEFFRAPDFYLGLYWGSVSMGQILSLPMMVLGVVVFYVAVKRRDVDERPA